MTMSGSAGGANDFSEPCETCDRETQHAVTIEFRVESGKPKNAQFSREPYRVSVCRRCGETRIRRMNDA